MLRTFIKALVLSAFVTSPAAVAQPFDSLHEDAERGVVGAQTKLCVAYYLGSGIPQNYDMALRWCSRGAEQGAPKAQAILALIYASGYGVKEDLIEAHKWANLAASAPIEAYMRRHIKELGHKPEAERLLGDIRKLEEEVRTNAADWRDSLSTLLTPEQVSEAQQRASAWKPKLEKQPAQAQTNQK